MKFTTTYSNINANFTFENIYSHVNKFWRNEVINKKEYTRIFLTIVVSTGNNKSYKLINQLPFNINNSNRGLFIVLKQTLNNKYFFSRKEILSNISFRYGFDKYNYSYSPKKYKYISYILYIFNSFISWLFKYSSTESKLAKNFYTSKFYTSNYYTSSLKENISNVDLYNLKVKSLKQHSDLLNRKKKFSIKSSSNKRKQQF